MKSAVLFFVSCLSALSLQSQAVFRVYFEEEKHKLSKEEKSRFNEWLYSFEVSQIDSVAVRGFSDSLGDAVANKNLSEKRAASVAETVSDYCGKSVQLRQEGMEENNKKAEQANRQVRITVWLRSEAPAAKVAADTSDIEAKEVTCYSMAREVLDYALIKRIWVNGKEKASVIISEETFDRINSQIFYYIINDFSGRRFVRLSWKVFESGDNWYKKLRYQAIVPYNAYVGFGVVKINVKPCDNCVYTNFNCMAFLNDSCYFRDNFVSENFQFKKVFLKSDEYLLRVPDEFIDMNQNYYFGRRTFSRLEFELSRNGKYRIAKVKNHYYRDIDLEFYRKRKICPFKGTASNSRDRSGFFCGRLCGTGGRSSPFYIGIEGGLNRFKGQYHPYAGLILSYPFSGSNSRLLIAYSHNKQVNCNLRYQYYLLSIPLSVLSPDLQWSSPKKSGSTLEPYPNSYFKLTLGSEFRSAFGPEMRFMEQNVHAGFRISGENINYFAQAGYALGKPDFKGGQFYSIIQAGIEYKLGG